MVEYDGELHLMLWDHYKWDGVSWTSLPSNPQGGMYQVPIVYKGEIHVLGNYSYKGSHYKWNGSSWTQVSTIPYGFYNGSAVVINDEIHILGGGSSVHYKWIGSSWTQVSEFPSGLKAFSVNNELYAYGGNRFYKFDGSRWEECGEGTSSSQHLSNNIIYSNGTLYSGIKRWDSSKNVWVDISVSTGYDRGNSSAPVIIYDDEFHFMGSTNDSYKRYHYKGVIHSDISGYLPQSTKICINGVSKTLITPKTNCIKDSDGLLVVQNDGFFEFSVKTRSVPIDYSIWG